MRVSVSLSGCECMRYVSERVEGCECENVCECVCLCICDLYCLSPGPLSHFCVGTGSSNPFLWNGN